jgi:two-component system, OmpR family, alkaline phosphatase synthesis response regulator PhoP
MAQAELSTRSAVVVEDDDLVSHLLQFILEGEGYAVTRVAEASSARELIANAAPPDLLTLDFMLPDGTGLELLALVRQTEEWKHVSVLMLSAESPETAVTSASDLGALVFVQKPFRVEDLRACISNLSNGALQHMHVPGSCIDAPMSPRYPS